MKRPASFRAFRWGPAAALLLGIEIVFVAAGFLLTPVLRSVVGFAFYFLSTPPPTGPTASELRTQDMIIRLLSPVAFAVIGAIVAGLAILAHHRIDTGQDS